MGSAAKGGGQSATPLAGAMTMPPLPDTDWDVNATHEYTAAQMRAYAEQAVAAERERCAAICDVRSADHWHDYKDRASPHRGDGRSEAASDEAEECAKAIRGHNVRIEPQP